MIAFHHFRDEDYEAVCEFLIELNRKDRRHINWNWARFEWMYGHPEFDWEARNAIGIWRDGNRVIGAAIYDMYFGEAFAGVLPEYLGLYPEVLAYAAKELKDDAGLGIAVCGDSEKEIEAIRAAGFVPAEQKETVMRRELDRIPESDLPEGYSITEPDPDRDITALQWLFWRGFDHGNDYEQFLREGQAPSRSRKHLDPRLGLAAMDPDGDCVSFCCLWYQSDTGYAYVEPVCTVPEHRGKGIAKALLYEAMNRAAALGAREAYVISDQEFYRRLGFRKEYVFPFFWKRD